MTWRTVLYGSLLTSALAGCALSERLNELDAQANHAVNQVEARHRDFQAGLDDRRRMAAQTVAQPWIAGKAQPLARELVLPLALRANVETTLLFSDDELDVRTIAQRITAATGIPVHVRPEALLPASVFMTRLAHQPAIDGSVTPVRMQFSAEAEPLAQILDRVAAALGVYWEHRHGRIVIFRTQTRVFDVRALTLEARAEASLGMQAGNTAEGGFSSASRTTLSSSNEDLFAVVRARLEPFLSQAGLMVAQPGAAASVIVTDTPDVLNNIADYLAQENRVLTRRVRLIFEELTLALHDQARAGLDWHVVFSNAQLAGTAVMAASDMTGVGMASISVARGHFQGSEAMVAALSQVGRVVRRSSVPVLTLNRRPVTHAVRTTFSYIDKIDTTSFGDGQGLALPSVSVSQKEETVGSLLTLVPDAQDDGRILLSIAYDNTVAQPIKTVRFGERTHPLQLQQVTIDGNGTVQQVVLQPGQPMLISGFDRRSEEHHTERPARGMPLIFGGHDKTHTERLMTIIIVTAQVEEGA